MKSGKKKSRSKQQAKEAKQELNNKNVNADVAEVTMITKELEDNLKLLQNYQKRKPRWIFKLVIILLSLIILICILLAVGSIMSIPNDDTGIFRLSQLALQISILAFFVTVLSFASNESYTKQLNDIKYLMVINNIVNITENKNISPETKARLISSQSNNVLRNTPKGIKHKTDK